MSVRDDQLDTLKVDGKDYEYYRIAAMVQKGKTARAQRAIVEYRIRSWAARNK